MYNMVESSGLQGLDTLLKTQVKKGFELARELEIIFSLLNGPDFLIISDYLDRIMNAFGIARGLISLKSSASNFEDKENSLVKGLDIDLGHPWKYVKDNRNSCSQTPSRSALSRSRNPDNENSLVKGLGSIDLGHPQKYVKDNRNSCSQSPSRSARRRSRNPDNENSLVKGLGGIDLGHPQKYVKDHRNSCSQSPSRSARPCSRNPSPMDYGSPRNVFEEYISTNWPGIGKPKCHEFADCWEDECFISEKERTITRKGKRAEHGIYRKGKRRYTSTSTRNVPVYNSEAGNDILPENGYIWCKYAQKKISGYVHPRMYYKCAFHNLLGCEAKKTQQRSNSNPSNILVTHIGVHSCGRHAQSFKNPFLISEIQDDSGKSPSYSRHVDSSAQRVMACTGHSADQMYRFQGSEKEFSADFIPSPQQNEGPSNCQAALLPCGLSSASEANYMPPTNPRMQTRDTCREFAGAFGTDLSYTSDADFWDSDADYWAPEEMGMLPTNPRMQTSDTLNEFAEAFGTDLSSTADANFWASDDDYLAPEDIDYLATEEMGMPPTNQLQQTMDTSESDIAALVSTTNSAVGSL